MFTFSLPLRGQEFVPAGRQPDWEGILRPRPADFIESLRDWIYPSLRPTATALPDIAALFPTVRDAIHALNAD